MLCPGRPRFSDVSHLLTHVSSKAHLANHFKLQVRGHQDKDAVQLLREYDDWYSANGLPTLLSDRINTKSDRQRKRKSHSNDIDESYEGPLTKKPRTAKKANVTPTTPLMNIPEYLDPRLMEPQPTAGIEQKSTADPLDEYLFPGDDPYRTDAPTISRAERRLRVATKSGFTSFIRAEDTTDGAADDGQEFSLTSHPTILVTPRSTKQRLRVSTRKFSAERTPDLFLVSNQKPEKSNDGDSDEKERSDEIARLKGVQWPGMDIFDSATSQMRRKRNQKKDSTVLKLLELTSSQAEPIERIYSLEGVLLRERLITGNVDEDDLLEGETPVAKVRPVRSKKKNVLGRKDPNLPIRKGGKKGRRSISRDHGQYDGAGSPRRSKRLNDIQPYYFDDVSDHDLSIRAFAKRPRGTFSILADSEQHGESPRAQQHARNHPAQETLTPARLILDHRTGFQNNFGRSYDDQTVPAKENIEPIWPQHGVELSDWNSPLAKRSGLNQHNYQQDFFLTEHEEDDDVRCGHRCNPLFAPSSRMGISYDDATYEDFTVPSSSWNIPRAQSSEETVFMQTFRSTQHSWLDSSCHLNA